MKLKIKVGDTITYKRYDMFVGTTFEEQTVESVAVRCGLDSEGYPISDEDYVTVGPDYREVDYDEIAEVNGQTFNDKLYNEYLDFI